MYELGGQLFYRELQARPTSWMEKRTLQSSFDNERRFAKSKLLLDG